MKLIKNKLPLLLIILASSIFLNGCIGVNSEFRSIRNSLLAKNQQDFHRRIELSIGQSGILLASMIVRMADTEENIDELLAQVSRIQFGFYELDEFSDPDNVDCKMMLDGIENQMKLEGWHYIVKTRSSNEMVAVFIRDNMIDSLNEMFVVGFNDRELFMVDLNGNLDRIIEVAIREHGLKFQMANN